MGTTGESATLHTDEHKKVVELAVKVSAGRVRVIAGAGSSATDEAIELAAHAKAAGADAALVVAPYYNRPSQAGMVAHFHAIAEAVQIPLVLYNVPGRTGSDLGNEAVAILARHPNIVAIKDATGDMSRIAWMRANITGQFGYLSGDDSSWLGYSASGGHGVISVASNVAPEAMVALNAAIAAGDYADARAWQDRLIGLYRALFLDNSPSPAKYALSRLGLCGEEPQAKSKVIAENRRARFDYFLEDNVEAGIQLLGTEIKALRDGRANIAESYAAVEGREIVLINADIPPYKMANRFNHEPRRHRKLLLHRKQIDKLIGAVQRDGRTIVPVRLYLNEAGKAKLEIALAKGKKLHDKREASAERDWQRDKARLLRDKG
ncbi:hypothetical protein LTR94_025805 [Friedmanniomyces endolithicus]|nr:hypothetical protein LTR94_025805 [Friedmanniomyces endolithicus]